MVAPEILNDFEKFKTLAKKAVHIFLHYSANDELTSKEFINKCKEESFDGKVTLVEYKFVDDAALGWDVGHGHVQTCFITWWKSWKADKPISLATQRLWHKKAQGYVEMNISYTETLK